MPTAETAVNNDGGGSPDRTLPPGRNFNEPGVVRTICENLMLSDSSASHNRARIAEFFNGAQPYTAEEEEALRISINLNDLTAVELMNVAYNRFTTVFSGPSGFATMQFPSRLPNAEALSLHLTNAYNDLLQEREDWMDAQVDRWRSVVLHGWASVVFNDPLDYLPQYVACDDIKFPKRTLANLTNASLFMVKRRYSLRELYEEALDPERGVGWNRPYLKQLIKEQFDQALRAWNEQGILEHYQPETLTMDLLSQTGWMTADVLPTLDVYMLYYFDERKRGWFVRGVPATLGRADQFVFKRDDLVVDRVRDILHVQVADAGNTTPRRIHLVRGLGRGMFGIGHLYTRLFCRFAEVLFESSYSVFRSGTTDSRERPQFVDMHHLSVLPHGVSWVPTNERYSADLAAMLNGLTYYKNEMVQRIRSYLAHYEQGAERETATQTNAKVAAAQGIMQSQVSIAMQQESGMHRTILRRLCDPAMMIRDEVSRFWDVLGQKGITPQMCDSGMVKVRIPRAPGAGDVFTSLMEGQAIMAIRPALPPASQPKAIRRYLMAISQDPDLTDSLQPDQPMPSPSAMRAAGDVAAASLGIMPIFDNTLNLPEYLPAFVAAIGQGLKSEAQEPKPDAADIEGFQKSLAIAAQLLGQLAQDPQQAPTVQQLKRQISALNKVAVEIARGIEEAEQEQPQQDPAMLKAMNDIRLDNERAQADMLRRMQELEQQALLFRAQIEASMAKARQAQNDAEQKRERAEQESRQQDALFLEQMKSAQARSETAEIGAEIAEVKLETAEKQKNQIGKEPDAAKRQTSGE